jgi:hypothetical protein
VMRRITVPMVGVMASSTILTLLVIGDLCGRQRVALAARRNSGGGRRRTAGAEPCRVRQEPL